MVKNLKKTIPTLLTVFVIIFAMRYNPFMTVAQQINPITTGQAYNLHGYMSSSVSDYSSGGIFNYSAPYNMIHYNEQFSSSQDNGNTQSTVLLVSNDNLINKTQSILGYYGFAIIIDTRANITSSNQNYNNVFDINMNPNWMNNSQPIQTSQRPFNNRQFERAYGNATYQLVFPSFFSPSGTFNQSFNFGNFIPNQDLPVTISKTITKGQSYFTLNGVSKLINYVNVTISILINQKIKSTTQIPLGDPNNSNTQWIAANVNIEVNAFSSESYAYDTSNGHLLQTNQYSMNNFNGTFDNSSFTVTPDPTNPSNSFIASLHSLFNHTQTNYNTNTVDNFRPAPISSGVAGLSTGDVLVYNSNNTVNSKSQTDYFGPAGNSLFTDTSSSNQFDQGKTYLTVFNTQPGSVDFLVEQLTSGSQTQSYNGNQGAWTSTNLYKNWFLDFNMHWNSNSSYELAPEFPPSLFVGNNQNNNQNNNGNNNNQDIFATLGVNPNINLKTINQRVEYHHITINGFDYLVKAEIHEAVYQKLQTFTNQLVNIDTSQGKMDLIINGNFNLTASVVYAYDTQTGDLLYRGEFFSLNINFDGTPQSPASFDHLQTSLWISSQNQMLLSIHPHDYQTSQTDFPTTSQKKSTSPGLPLPGFELFYAIGALITTITIIKRKKISK